MDWVQVAAIASPIVTGIGIIVMRNEARAVAKEIVLEAVESALAKFKLALLDEMNGKYLRTREQLKDNASYERRLDDHDDRIDKIETDMRNVAGSLSRHHRQ